MLKVSFFNLNKNFNKLTKFCLISVKRNSRGDDRLYVAPGNTGYKFVRGLYINEVDKDVESSMLIDGVQGTVLLTDECVEEGGILTSPVMGLHSVSENSVYTVRYRDPVYPSDFIFPAKKLNNAIDPPTVLKAGNSNYGGGGGRGGYGGGGGGGYGGGNGGGYKPQIGFNRNFPQASLGDAGHRMVNRNFASVGPPSQIRGKFFFCVFSKV